MCDLLHDMIIGRVTCITWLLLLPIIA